MIVLSLIGGKFSTTARLNPAVIHTGSRSWYGCVECWSMTWIPLIDFCLMVTPKLYLCDNFFDRKRGMDRNTITGIILIFLLFYLWARLNAPSEEQLAEMQRVQDSIALEEERLAQLPAEQPTAPDREPRVDLATEDSLQNLRRQAEWGVFAPAANGTAREEILENDFIRVTFNTKGGNIKSVFLKEFQKLVENEERKDVFEDLYLMEDEKNRFEYHFPAPFAPNGVVKSSDLYFEVSSKSDRDLTLTANLDGGRSISQVYTLNEGDYTLDYQLKLVGLDNVLPSGTSGIVLNWVNYLDKIEKNYNYEKTNATVYYKEIGEDPSYCSSTGDDIETLDELPLKWVSHAHQFFNTSLIADKQFDAGVLETRNLDESEPDLKYLSSVINVPFSGSADETIDMMWYLGPNEFDRLQSFGVDLEDVVPYGWSIFGTINRWVIRPIYNFLSQYIGSAGIVILLLTLIVKSLVYPLTYKMLYSQSKMGALKPQMAKLKEKYKDDQQKVQMETMKIYREYGVNPAGGCFPMILQMPIWFALYRFFPASIEFRQASFLWANDLSSYDVFFQLPFEVPFLGGHISLFTFLWAVSMLIYTYYNSKIMDMSSINPMMKYMQYLMPLMFVFFFNNFASGLTCYLLFSNLMNITQTIVTKNYLIDSAKIQAELDANKKKPKKKGGFQQRLAKALEEQQKIAQQKAKRG